MKTIKKLIQYIGFNRPKFPGRLPEGSSSWRWTWGGWVPVNDYSLPILRHFPPTPKCKDLEDCIKLLPNWAKAESSGSYLEEGAQLCTRNGRRIGNAFVSSVQFHPGIGKDVAEVFTDIGTRKEFTEAELKELFFQPKFIMDVEARMKRVSKLRSEYGEKTHFEKLKKVLSDLSIGFQVVDSEKESLTIIRLKQGEDKINGYSGFYTDFDFNKDGSCREVGAYE